MAGRLPRLRFLSASVYACRPPSVTTGGWCVRFLTASRSVGAQCPAIPLGAVERAAHALRFFRAAASESAIDTAGVRTVPASSARTKRHATVPRDLSHCSEHSAFPSTTTWSLSLFTPRFLSPSFCLSSSVPVRSTSVESSSPLCGSGSSPGRGSDVICDGFTQRLRNRGEQEEQKVMPHGHENTRKFQEQEHSPRHGKHQDGRRRRRRQFEDASEEYRDCAIYAMLAVSPILFTQWDETSNPANEFIFLVGNTLGYCTEKFFENEYGQSIFAFVLGLVYLALLGYEGKVNGAVWRMKHVFGTNMRIVGHPRYAYALPRNPLLGACKRSPSK